VSTFAAIREPAYRRLLFAMTVSEIGLYAFETALFWSVFVGTGSTFDVALLYAGLVLPVLVLSVPVGILVDRRGPRAIFLWASVAATAVVGVAALIASTTGIGFEIALLLALLEGVFFACWAIPVQVIAARVVHATSMSSAIGLSAIPSGVGSIVGGLLGGVLVETSGSAAAFGVAAIGLGISVVAIVGLPVLPGLERGAGMAALELRAAGRWVIESPVASAVVVLGAAAGFLVMSRFSLMPAVVRDVLAGGPSVLGLLTTAGGVGSLLGTLTVEGLGRRIGRGPALIATLGIAGASLAGIGVSRHLAIALPLAAILAGTMIVTQLTSQTLLQMLAPARMRGRVLALYDVVRLGLVPAGSLVAGAIVPSVGISGVLVAYGVALLLIAAATIVLCRPLVVVRDPPALAADPAQRRWDVGSP
jgi:MFS family permease